MTHLEELLDFGKPYPKGKRPMLAFRAQMEDSDWCTLVHGETRGKAKSRFHRVNPASWGSNEFIYIRLRRLPGLDNLPFTFENCGQAGFHFIDEYGEELMEADFHNDCDCETCARVWAWYVQKIEQMTFPEEREDK
jgi:hypothetical protein